MTRWLAALALLAAAASGAAVVPFAGPYAKLGQVLSRTSGDAVEINAGGLPDAWWHAQFGALLNESDAGGSFLAHPTKEPHIKGTHNLIVANGYPAEEHTVETADGYLLTAFRVPQPGRPAVFLMHGLLASSADYVVTGKGRSLALLLHDAGFDVWMGNARGTTPSRRHKRLQPSNPKFWDFSWHEIGERDLPALIDYVLESTNQSALHYIGHSQGTTSFFVMGSERPEYMSKIKTYIALAPVAFLRDIRTEPLRLMALARDPLNLLLHLVGVNEFLPTSALITTLGDMFCAQGDRTQPICFDVLFLICGTDTQQMDERILPKVLVNTPAGASTKQLLHYGQLIAKWSLVFKKFDYGWFENLYRYRRLSPPEYDLSRVTAPTYLFFSDNDLLAVQSNVAELMRRLPNVAPDGVRRVPLDAFSHLDYLFAKDVKRLVYDDVIEVIRSHEVALEPATR